MASVIALADMPVLLQGDPAPGYSAIEVRRLVAARMAQEGVMGSGDYKVTPGAGAKQLAVATGEAGVDGDTVANQGRYYQRCSVAQTLDLALAPDVTNPRIDQLILEIKDDAHDASGLNQGRLRVLSGTATAGATLDNRSGAAALPSTALRLADILVPANFNAVFVQNTHIRDRRPWARGACCVVTQSGVADATTTSGSVSLIDSAGMQPRVELSGVPLHVWVHATASTSTVSGGEDFVGVNIDGTRQTSLDCYFKPSVAGLYMSVPVQGIVTPTAGSHLVGPTMAANGVDTMTVRRNSTSLALILREAVRPSASNDGA